MQKRNKIIVILILIIFIIAIVFIANLNPIKSDNNKNLVYQNGEISFQYPEKMKIVNEDNGSHIVTLEDPETSEKIVVNRQIPPTDYNINDVLIVNNLTKNFILQFKNNITINGIDILEVEYKINNKAENSHIMYQNERWIEKNGAIYSVISVGTKETTYKEGYEYSSEPQSNLEIITKSLKINDTSISSINQSASWGKITIPRLGVNWNIRSDTVNSYSFVYHYAESYFFGQNGTSGLLGHHTSYSAPFDNINTLKSGDKVIIEDFLSQKKYIYEVVSNGDVKYDYKTNPIQFQGGSSNLTLVTCWPEGTEDAAWQVHCKLITIENL